MLPGCRNDAEVAVAQLDYTDSAQLVLFKRDLPKPAWRGRCCNFVGCVENSLLVDAL